MKIHFLIGLGMFFSSFCIAQNADDNKPLLSSTGSKTNMEVTNEAKIENAHVLSGTQKKKPHNAVVADKKKKKADNAPVLKSAKRIEE
ncbi:MAG: hypothetical protein LC101_02520 [Flavobacteriales bacterium]|nr:hypothetical protein [Flavobacteriales bacterium]